MGIGKGSAKILFFGEHAAVQGHPALGAALPWKITAEYQETEEGTWEFPSLPREYRQNVLDALSSLEDSLGHRLRRGILRLKSDIPIGAGFGSSGALCAALVQALSPGSFPENWRLAHEMEKNFHGKPSGIDTALALREGITAFQSSGKTLPIPSTLPGFDLHLVAGALPRSGSAKELVMGIQSRVTAGDKKVLGLLEELGRTAALAIESLKTSGATAATWGAWADQAQNALGSLGLSLPEMEDLLNQGRSTGALGGKLSGAGAGGAFFLIYPSAQAAQKGKESLRSWGSLRGLGWAAQPEAFRWDQDLNRLTLGRSAFDALFS